MIKTLKGNPHNYSQLELDRMDSLSKEQFLKGSEIIDEEEVLGDSRLEDEIKEQLKSVSGLRQKPTLRR